MENMAAGRWLEVAAAKRGQEVAKAALGEGMRILDSMTGSGSSADRGKKEEAKVVKFAWDPSSFS